MMEGGRRTALAEESGESVGFPGRHFDPVELVKPGEGLYAMLMRSAMSRDEQADWLDAYAQSLAYEDVETIQILLAKLPFSAAVDGKARNYTLFAAQGKTPETVLLHQVQREPRRIFGIAVGRRERRGEEQGEQT